MTGFLRHRGNCATPVPNPLTNDGLQGPLGTQRGEPRGTPAADLLKHAQQLRLSETNESLCCRKRDTLTPIMLPGRSKFDPRFPLAEQEEMTGLWQENSALRRELKEMKKLLLSTQTGCVALHLHAASELDSCRL